MATLTEGAHTGDHIISDMGSISRDVMVLASGSGALEPGTVVARVTASGKLAPYDNAGTDGTEAAFGILFAAADATSADVRVVVHTRLTEVKTSALKWADGLDGTGQTAGLADLAAKFIIAR